MYTQDERIKLVAIEDEMRTSYINYAMSVIISRALPDVRDGLKPVHRRVIYAMRDLGLVHSRPHKKCAAVVGRTMQVYHPHGDGPIYDTLVRMAQDFRQRYLLVDGQGNYGSVDGDPPAAMRYTEARMTRLTEHLLADIDKDTVDFEPNFDESEVQPTVLPAGVPNLLVNGSEGIAVGMATSIPPHNLGEVVDACKAYMDNPDITVEELMRIMPGPDFPTGGSICGRSGIHEAYKTGRGKITLQATANFETGKGGKESIIITEIPYQLNKATLIEDMANLVRDKKIEGIANLRDESDRDGMRIVIELKRDGDGNVVLNQLWKHTRLRTTYSIIMLALVDKQPMYLPLPRILGYFLDHRRDVVRRRTNYELNKARERAHVLEGLLKALDLIDEIIALIRSSADADTARAGLVERFDFTVRQAKAILEMQLQRLTGLEREKLLKEFQELQAAIADYLDILERPERLKQVLHEELDKVKELFGDERRTQIVNDASDLTIEDLIAQENVVVTVSRAGYIKRMPISTYRAQGRGGRGITAMGTREEDFVQQLFVTSTHHYLMLFSDRGKAYWLKVYELPSGGRAARGKAVINCIQVESGEQITAIVPVQQFDDKHYLIMVTRQGTIKKTSLDAYANPRKAGIIAITLDEGDHLIDVQMTDGNSDIIMATREGKAIRFSEEDVRAMGRGAAGVRAITLRPGDIVVGMEIARDDTCLLTVTENGYGKRTLVSEYRKIKRGGQGVIDIQTSDRNGLVAGIAEVFPTDEIMVITQQGVTIRQKVDAIREISRNTQGVRVIKLDESDKVVSICRVMEENTDNGEAPPDAEEGEGPPA